MWGLLVKPLLGVAGDAVKGFVDTKKAKAELKVTEVKAATNYKHLLYIACSASFGIKGASSAVKFFGKK